ncbi:MAG: GAF domain-containing protein [Ktedonobacteraceae bacterium]|nr:GAF domain-containing protein [Ktedonobacteraceae bacterium]
MKTKVHPSTLEEAVIIERVARLIASVRAARPNYALLAAELEQVIPFDIFGIVLLRHDRQAVRITVCHREVMGWKAVCHQHPLEGSRCQQVLQQPELLIGEYPEGLDELPAASGDALSRHHQLRSTLIAPLMVGDRVLGTLELGSVMRGAYADQTLQRLVKAVVGVLAAAIEGAQQGGSVEIQNRQREALKIVSSSLVSRTDLATILRQIVSGIAGALNAASAILMRDRLSSRVSLQAQYGLDESLLRQLLDNGLLAGSNCIVGKTLQSGQPYISQDIGGDGRFPDSAATFSLLGIRSVFSYPLAVGTAIYGVLLLCSPEAGGYTPLKAEILSLFADQAVVAIHNSILLEAIYEHNRFQQVVKHQGLCVEKQDARNADEGSLRAESFVGTQALLMQTAEDALVHAGTLGKLSRLITHLQQSADWVRDGWFVVDLRGICTYMNAAAQALCNVQKGSEASLYDLAVPGLPASWKRATGASVLPITRAFDKWYPRMRNEEEVRAYLLDFAQGATCQQELRCVLAGGTADRRAQAEQQRVCGVSLLEDMSGDSYYLFTRYPLYNQQGQLEASALQVRDITRQVRAENNFSALLSSVSHDLRTPLTTIKAAVTGLLQRDMAWSEQDRYAMLEDINSEADHLTEQVHNLIELSRIQTGTLTLAKEWCDVIEIWHGVWQKLERAGVNRPVYLQAQQNLPLIYVDHVQLDRVLYNLVENAVRRAPEQTEVRVVMEVMNNGKEMLRVRVIDRGKAVPERLQAHLFQSFHVLRSYGNGLALAICKGVLDAHEGHIWVEANVADEGGTCFVFALPTGRYVAVQQESTHTLPVSGSAGRTVDGEEGRWQLREQEKTRAYL